MTVLETPKASGCSSIVTPRSRVRRNECLAILASCLTACSSSAGGGARSEAGLDGAHVDGTTPDGGTRDASRDQDGDREAGRDAAQHAEAGREAGGSDGGGLDATADGHPAADASDGAMPRSDAATADGSLDAPGTCSGAICFAGQTCVEGACSFTDCTGAHVPGDYATVQDAVNAILPTGGTICLAAQTYAEVVQVALMGDRSANPPLAFQGVGAGQTVLNGFTSNVGGEDGQTPSLELTGITLNSMTLTLGGATVSMSACAVGPILIYSEPDDSTGSGTVNLDGVDLSAGSQGTALTLIDVNPTDLGYPPVAVTITNSYIHDSKTGIFVNWGGRGTLSGAAGQDALAATLANDTLENLTTAVDISVADDNDSIPQATVAVTDDLFVDNGLALEVTVGDALDTTLTEGNNGYFGNTTKFGGIAVPAPGDVNGDPMLDTSTAPPGLLAGSPDRAAASAQTATTHDFWGRPRGATPDIGAVQSSP